MKARRKRKKSKQGFLDVIFLTAYNPLCLEAVGAPRRLLQPTCCCSNARIFNGYENSRFATVAPTALLLLPSRFLHADLNPSRYEESDVSDVDDEDASDVDDEDDDDGT